MKSVCFGIIATVLLSLPAHAQRNNTTCGIEQGQPLSNAYGPWDFTNPGHSRRLPIVINAPVTAKVEQLIAGENGTLLGDIDYTLRAIPNYHRALNAIGKYYRLHPPTAESGVPYYTADCYFQRAIYFQPADTVSRMLYGMHLHLSGKHEQAEKIYLTAVAMSSNYAELHYNLGLLYVDMKNLEKAAEHAKIAYGLQYPLKGLESKIVKAGGKL